MSYLELIDLSIGYETPLISRIDLTADKKEVIAIVGLNGSGKSTLLKSLARINPLKGGKVLINGQDVSNFSKVKFSKIIGFSSIGDLNTSNLNVLDLVSLGRIPHTNLIGCLSEKDKNIVNEAIENTEISDLKNKKISKISDGQKQRAYIARLLAQQTDILLFDEPTAFLDVAGKYKIIALFREIAKNQNKIVIFSTHDLKIAIQNSDKIWLINGDSIIENSPEDLILNKSFNKLFEDKNIVFDNLTADFYVEKKLKQSIKVENKSGNDLNYFWTKNALNRVGYKINENSEIKITILENLWSLDFYKNFYTFESLYKLLNFLQNETQN